VASFPDFAVLNPGLQAVLNIFLDTPDTKD
jgi:hypothetical protein